MEINSTVRPSGHVAVSVVTTPSVVEVGGAHPSIERHVALTTPVEDLDGPSGRDLEIGKSRRVSAAKNTSAHHEQGRQQTHVEHSDAA
jgi:hypothetical protein